MSFFFSSRRRHTRFDCDWSSDVCSSDLGAELPISDVVRSSWSRCLNAFALDPHEIRHPHSVEWADLQARRERLGVLLSIARIEMEALGKLMKHSESSIMLTDSDGVIVSYLGDTGFSATARRSGF